MNHWMHYDASMRRCDARSGAGKILFAACVLALSLSCQTPVTVLPPPCPIPDDAVVMDVTEMTVLMEYVDVLRYLAEIDRYCGAVAAMAVGSSP